MNLRYLLDTNTISEPLKPYPDAQVAERLDRFHNQLALPVFVVYELLRGAYLMPESKKRLRVLRYVEQTIRYLPVLPYTQASAEWHGREAARLQALGKSPPFIDAQIAAVAVTNDLVLVTRNTADFINFSGLQLENWFPNP